jgi:hypothetical protein
MHPFTAGLSDLALLRHSPFWADCIINTSGRFYGRDKALDIAVWMTVHDPGDDVGED